ncbi:MULTISPECIES: replication initiation protein [Lactiplantibacillus]|uniref:replication initiation protein n=1 Tax=Lactiplantibacillus TaxID=2767842 RepID=UPI000CA2136F|nr:MULTISPECIES: replication initiation protein [Lactiplantibacillus]AUH38839.1 replication initiation protein [Lactiplantibacillus plantarum]MBT9654383.1 RepB family plasmid replication initiator protein [Lactiplantibacillus plantarum]MBU7446447.1 replication initiation protein [Lactiplantibacillus plantarum]MBU7459522.1 replication initiation protein [Lactiplantibacillus plantarum]MBU7469081.1 replication initiation protein [Lactiplantibacillus plantarum]
MQGKISKKANVAFSNLLSRQDYLVVQGNDLAKAFGNLSAFEHQVLDYCFSFVTQDSKADDEYSIDAIDLIHHLGLNSSGHNYERIAKALKSLNEKTALYFRIESDGVPGILMTQLFSHIKFFKNGHVTFQFSQDAAPYVFDLRSNYYSFKLSELSRVKSKYSLIMLKLIEANQMGNQNPITIKGSLEDWQGWFLGADRRWPAGRFMRDTINVAIDELYQKMGLVFTVTTLKHKRSIVGYVIEVTKPEENRKIKKVIRATEINTPDDLSSGNYLQ